MANLRFPKFVLNFRSTGGETPIINRLTGPAYEGAKSVFEQHLVDIAEFQLIVTRIAAPRKASLNVDIDGPFWEFYPKMEADGDITDTEENLLIGFDAIVPDMQAAIRTDILGAPINATGVKWIITKFDGTKVFEVDP